MLAQHLHAIMMFQRLAMANGYSWKRFILTVDQVLPKRGIRSNCRWNLPTQRFAAAFRAISARCSSVRLAARAAPPLRPISTAAAFLPSSSASGVCPVAMSTMSFPSWTGSRGRFLRVVVMRTSCRCRRIALARLLALPARPAGHSPVPGAATVTLARLPVAGQTPAKQAAQYCCKLRASSIFEAGTSSMPGRVPPGYDTTCRSMPFLKRTRRNSGDFKLTH